MLRNINPVYLANEPNSTNQSRKLCHMYFERQIWKFELGILGECWWGEDELKQYCKDHMDMCLELHSGLPCSFSLKYYSED